MSRVGSGSRSFLDDLLADDFDKPSSGRGSAKPKSVRFVDNDDSAVDFKSSLTTSARDRQRSVDPMEWSKTDASGTSNRQSSATKSANKSDWLGLGDEEDLVGRQTRGQTSSDKSVTNVSNDQKDDWLNAGLSARKNRTTTESKTNIDSSDKSEDNLWLSIRKRAEESKAKISEEIEEKSISTQKIDGNENKINVSNNKSETDLSREKQSNEKPYDIEGMQTSGQTSLTPITSQTSDASKTALSTSSAMLLNTQVSEHLVYTNSTHKSTQINTC